MPLLLIFINNIHVILCCKSYTYIVPVSVPFRKKDMRICFNVSLVYRSVLFTVQRINIYKIRNQQTV